MELKFSLFNRPKLYDFYNQYKESFGVCKVEVYCEDLFTRYKVLEFKNTDFESEEVFEKFLKSNDQLRIFHVLTGFGIAHIKCGF